MTSLPLGLNDWGSDDENAPRLRLQNMYVVVNPLSPTGQSHVSRPTLGAFSTSGTNAVSGIWRQEGTLSGDILVVSGTFLYRVALDSNAFLIGSIPGTGLCQFAGLKDRVLIVRDGIAYSTDGDTITTVNMPDDVSVGSVACINSYFLLSVLDSDRWYWIIPGGTDPDALDFATAERSPDPIISINVVSDEIWFLGSTGPEVWSATGDPDAPFNRISGRVYSDGCLARATVVSAAKSGTPALIWVTDSKAVVLAQGVPHRISDESIEELLRSADNLRAWAFKMNRHDFYVLTSDSFTSVYDITTDKWLRWTSYNDDIWQAHLGTQAGSSVYAGSATDGTIWSLSEDLDDVEGAVVKIVSGRLAIPDKPIPCKSILIRVNAGWSPSYDYEPKLEFRFSDNLGATWSSYYEISMGNRGEFDTDVVFRSLGLMTRPGRDFEFRFAGPSRLRIDYATVNDV